MEQGADESMLGTVADLIEAILPEELKEGAPGSFTLTGHLGQFAVTSGIGGRGRAEVNRKWC